MARYNEIAIELARRVRCGELAVGGEVPAVREYAATHATTASTVARAYRALTAVGVLNSGERRRARVAPAGALAAARYLDGDRVFRLAGSDDPALEVLLENTDPAAVELVDGARGSFAGLRALARGQADGAAIHLRHRDGTGNAGFTRALLHARDPHLLHLWRREQGLLVPSGNPQQLTGASDLARNRVARREPGAGTRVLLEQLVLAEGAAPESVVGPVLPTHLETALAVAAGVADTALGLRSHAAHLGLEFLPLTWESYDIALAGDDLGAIQALTDTLADPPVRAAIIELGGYDLTHAGAVTKLGPIPQDTGGDVQPRLS